MAIVRTVTGDVSTSDVGTTLMHEHLLIDSTYKLDADDVTLPGQEGSRSVVAAERLDAEMSIENLWWMRSFPQPTAAARTNYRLGDVETAIEEVRRFAAHGGSTIVDVTGFRMGRDPRALREIAYRTGLNIVAGTGYYLPSSFPPDMDGKSPEVIAAEIVRDVRDGIHGTDVRAGIIGEIGATEGYLDHPMERNSFRGAALAQRETGLPITVHPPYFFQEAHDILDDLEDMGADLSKVIIGHLDGTIRDENALEYHRSIAERGAYLEYDVFGRAGYRPSYDASWPLDGDRIMHISELLEEFGDRILVSHDVCAKTHLTRYGGFGYDYIPRCIVPRLHKRGFSEEQIDRILVANPADALGFSE